MESRFRGAIADPPVTIVISPGGEGLFIPIIPYKYTIAISTTILPDLLEVFF
jgi:hypothetical protein